MDKRNSIAAQNPHHTVSFAGMTFFTFHLISFICGYKKLFSIPRNPERPKKSGDKIHHMVIDLTIRNNTIYS